jgi:hypothetical protein
MKLLAALFISLLLSDSKPLCITDSQQADFGFLVGVWKMQRKNSVLFEEWTLTSGSYRGRGYIVRATGDTMVTETTLIDQRSDGLYFVPTTQNQNNKQPVYFRMTSVSDSGFISENKEHDFPQTIAYTVANDSILHVKIDGTVSGKYRKEEFSFKRAK